MPTTPLTPEQKARWNRFIDFVQEQKVNPAVLDQRNKQVGLGLLQKFNMTFPKDALPLEIIPQVQTDLQNYRTNLISQWKSGKIAPIEGVKTEADIMPNISPVDSWPGSKTLSSRFPIAKTDTKDYGTNVDQFDKDHGLVSTK